MSKMEYMPIVDCPGAKDAVSDGKIQKYVKYSEDFIQLISGPFEICGTEWLGRS